MIRKIVAVIAVAGLVGCSARRPAGESPFPAGAMGEAAAIARARADSMRYPYTAADIRFMSGMIGHHAQAIVMSRLVPTRGASAAIVRLSERIINAQADEIALMQRWLAERRQPVPVADTMAATLAMAGHDHGSSMPGMLTADQMKRLGAARNSEFDRLFLTYMIQHHQGAVAMVKELFTAHGAGQDETVFKFASDVEVDQTTEINRMLEMLLQLPGDKLTQ